MDVVGAQAENLIVVVFASNKNLPGTQHLVLPGVAWYFVMWRCLDPYMDGCISNKQVKGGIERMLFRQFSNLQCQTA